MIAGVPNTSCSVKGRIDDGFIFVQHNSFYTCRIRWSLRDARDLRANGKLGSSAVIVGASETMERQKEIK